MKFMVQIFGNYIHIYFICIQLELKKTMMYKYFIYGLYIFVNIPFIQLDL